MQQGEAGKTNTCVGESAGDAAGHQDHPSLLQAIFSIATPWEHMHRAHKFMRVDDSLPPGIMRDRALAERDFVTFPEIFFFSVLSNRCRAM